jgi:hypothetical protein
VIPQLSSTAGFDPEGALAWRNTNFALRKSIEVFLHVEGLTGSAYDMCMAASTVAMVSACPACIPFTVVDIITETAKFAILLALDISEQVYAEIVDGQDGDAAAEQDSATYQNVIITHGNVIATHTLLTTVLTIVSGTQTGLTKKWG